MMTYAEIEAALRERGTSIYHPVMGAFERRGHKAFFGIEWDSFTNHRDQEPFWHVTERGVTYCDGDNDSYTDIGNCDLRDLVGRLNEGEGPLTIDEVWSLIRGEGL